MPSYYDINTILAEEELIPCTTLLDFNHLAHLDPDLFVHNNPNSLSDENKSNGSSNNDDEADKRQRKKTRTQKQKPTLPTFLPESSKIKVPLWAVETWAMLGFVRVQLPRHYGKKSREKLVADPALIDLRRKNERFFMSGILLVNLIERCSSIVAAAAESRRTTASSNSSNSTRRTAHAAAMAEVLREAKELRQTLLLTFTGERLRRTFDWTLSNIDDDVTSYTKRLTNMERRLFERGASAASAHAAWKNYGSRRITVSETALRASAIMMQQTPRLRHRGNGTTGAGPRAVTPDQKGDPLDLDVRFGGGRKRIRVS